ncbi:MAG: Modification methylase DpnIIA [Chroococcopsis gigantea SAG 12.99]|jgi:DNA adenine methylase|nr:DNA adenine methylase [Chlorogloea purpurea SAG 13.99]MDV3000723.1 Modification methylase DpnIIA [Chroococcopsis gigantea SAG 12.99]
MSVSLVKTKDKIQCKPYLKWVGGKSQLKSELISRLPTSFNRYFEPFIGGGALFFTLQPHSAFISDINPDLINTYQVVKDYIEELIQDLKQHVYDQDYYLKIRNIDRSTEFSTWTKIQKASRLIYLNKSCFNGLYRVNSKGHFNVPFGRYTNPTLVDDLNLRACSKVLKNCQIGLNSFLAIEHLLQKNDFVYFDPPYAPLNTTSNFTSYTPDGFAHDMQVALKNFCDRLTDRGVQFMLSNSSAQLILDLYSDYKIELVYATRAINSKAHKRGKIPEVIVRNYQ